MTFLEIFEKYKLTPKEVHTLKVMKDRGLIKNCGEVNIEYGKWFRMRQDGILKVMSSNHIGNYNCKVADFVHE